MKIAKLNILLVLHVLSLCHIYQYVKVNNKYMKVYDKNKESLYLKYLDVNNLYDRAMLQKFPVNSFEWIDNTSQFNEHFIKNYIEKSDEGYFLEVDAQCLEKLHDLHNYLPFLPVRMKIEKFERLVANLHDWNEYFIHIRNLKGNQELVLKKFHKILKFKQMAWSKSYIDMKTGLRKKAKQDSEKDLFKLMNNAVFGKLWKMWENIELLNLSQQNREETICC